MLSILVSSLHYVCSRDTDLVQNEALILNGWKQSSAGDTLLLELCAGLLPGIVVGVSLFFKGNTSILQKQPTN